MPDTPSVLIGIPSDEHWYARFGLSLLNLVCTSAQVVPLTWWNARSCYVTGNRNECIRRAKEVGASKLFYVDADMTFPPDTLLRLLAHQKNIICATYSRRTPPFFTLGELVDATEPMRTGLVSCRRVPTGCLLLDLKVFDAMEYPWFRMAYQDGQEVGEDYNFCEQIRGLFDIWCDCDLSREVRHCGVWEFENPSGLWPAVEVPHG